MKNSDILLLAMAAILALIIYLIISKKVSFCALCQGRLAPMPSQEHVLEECCGRMNY